DMVCMYCQSYAAGRLDVTIPDPVTRLKERHEDLKDLRIYFYFWCFYGFFWCFSVFHQFNPQSFCFLWCSS
ncbi:hypothetical protein, partial [Mordavella massiliensis]|uniref:hypothetical protein n=1 Tax=Mordavella massiliensis TaxID=1871024 RepID=UPI00195742EF